MKFSLIFLFLFLLVLTPMVVAQPPPTTTIVISVDTGIAIDFPKQDVFEQNQAFRFDFHVFNISSGLRLDNTTTNCSFELFDNKGIALVDVEIIDFDFDEFEIDINGGNFSRLGDYHFLTDCSTDSIGGFVSQPIVVTTDGFAPNPFPFQLSIIVLSFLLVGVGLIKDRFRLMKHAGSILLMVMGVLTLYPGYSFINYSTLTGLALGTILIGIGFYFLIEDSFSREEQEEFFDQGGGG